VGPTISWDELHTTAKAAVCPFLPLVNQSGCNAMFDRQQKSSPCIDAPRLSTSGPSQAANTRQQPSSSHRNGSSASAQDAVSRVARRRQESQQETTVPGSIAPGKLTSCDCTEHLMKQMVVPHQRDQQNSCTCSPSRKRVARYNQW